MMRVTHAFLWAVAWFYSAINLSGAPPNDHFTNRTVLIGTNVSVAGNNWFATSETGEDTGGGAVYWFYSVWYSWTAPTNGVVHLSGNTTVWNFYMSIRAYRGPAVNALSLAPTLADGGVPVTAGDTIAIQVASIYYPIWSGGGGSGPFTLNLSLEVPVPPPPNDRFAERTEMTVPEYHFDGSIYNATNEPGEPLPSGTSQTLWWKFSAPEEGVLTVTISAPQFSPVIRLYDGASLASLSAVASLSGWRYRVQPGRAYSLQMATPYVPGGGFALDARFSSLTNDFFASSAHLEGTNATFAGSLILATREPNEPLLEATNTIWVSWAMPITGRARFSRLQSPDLRNTGLYTGPTVPYLQRVRTVSMDNGRYDFLAIAGTVYHFQLAGGFDSRLTLQLMPWAPVANDAFANALLLKGNHPNQEVDREWFSIGDATAETGEPPHLDAAAFKSLWWKWTAPVHGWADFWANRSVASNVVVAAYTGESVEALTLLAKGTSNARFPVNGGDDYYIAAAVPPEAIGDVLLYGGIASQASESRAVPGNLLQEPSWEGTAILSAQYWRIAGGVGGFVNEPRGADGTTWPTLGNSARIWQDIPTVPGQKHRVRFALSVDDRLGGQSGEAKVRVLWDEQQVGITTIPTNEMGNWNGFWHWAEFTAVANFPTSRVAFENMARNVSVDAFSVVPLTSPPEIVNEPTSASVIAGGTVAFVVGVKGSLPLTYIWHLDGLPVAMLSKPVFEMENAASTQAGTYRAVVSNAFGAVTSAPVTLVVDAPIQPLIVFHPYGDTVAAGGYHNFSVVAAGSPPLRYQWVRDGSELNGATNRTLTFTSTDFTNAGVYRVRVSSDAGLVWSLDARLIVTNAVNGGGKINFANRFFFPGNLEAPIFDIDSVTQLNGSNYVAQLYAGPSLELLRPAGRPSHFQSGFSAGYFYPQMVTLPTVPPGSNAMLQVRAWDASKGSSYEEARGLGGKFGKSELLTITAGGGPMLPANLIGLQSFSLQAGRPQFASGQISFLERRPGNILWWSHHGEPGFRYVIEKSIHGFEWQPYLVITNLTTTAIFSDSANSGSSEVFYRSRILD